MYATNYCREFQSKCDTVHAVILEFEVASRASFIVASKEEKRKLFDSSRLAVKVQLLLYCTCTEAMRQVRIIPLIKEVEEISLKGTAK